MIWWKVNYWWLKTFWIFAKVKCTSSPGLITQWTPSTHNFCPSGFARSHRKLFFIFKISLLLLSNFNIRSHSWQILTLWSNETWCSWYFTIKGQTPNLMTYFPERENYENLSSKKLQDLSNQVLYAKMFLILGILWMFSMTHYILHRW